MVNLPVKKEQKTKIKKQMPKTVSIISVSTRLLVFPIIILLQARLAQRLVVDGASPRLLPARSGSSLSQLYSSRTMEWQTIDPTTFFDSPQIADGRQIAKDVEYLNSILNHWNAEGFRSYTIEASPISYTADGDEPDILLHGHVLRRINLSSQSSGKQNDLPVILLFHTAAGPQDVFLYYKADVLLQKFDCLVMICDILSDPNGWGWDSRDRTRYNNERLKLMDHNAQLLKARVLAGIQALVKNVPSASIHQMAAMGFCLGGQPILELARLDREYDDFSVRAMITFHGVFARGVPLLLPTTAVTETDIMIQNKKIADKPSVLICNGDKDPFVTSKDVEDATKFLEGHGFVVEVMNVKDAKHGFTNPAQDFNPNPAFGYSTNGSILTWIKTLDLLRSTMLS